jgi:Origin recognition complex (ORC) subunit 5 C-terminus
VLQQPRHCYLITGKSDGKDEEDPATTRLQQKVYRSFINALIQSVYDSTTDLKEILRLGRLLWPQYVEPLQPDRIDKTLEAATSRCLSLISKKHDSSDKKDGASAESLSSEEVEGQVLAILNQKILPQMRPFLAASLYTLSASAACAARSTAVSFHDLPDLAKYLLLAGYLCQVNRPDRDKHLFSIQKNGRRRKSQALENTAAENVAMGLTQQQQQQHQQTVQRIPRLRSFPMERLLSVFISVVALNQESSSSTSNAAMSFIEQSERLQSLGNNTLGQLLTYLQSTGLLHEHPPRGPADVIRLSEPRYCCSLTEDDARRIAQTLKFPLERYLL